MLVEKENNRSFQILNPQGQHAICAGLKDDIEVSIKGHTGYYCAGMNKNASITVHGNVGTGVAENMMSGKVISQRECFSICWCNWSWWFFNN